jgi:hypothetical protein
MEQSAKVVLVNNKDEEVASFIVKRLTVGAAMRRQRMFAQIDEEDEAIRGQLFSASSLACALHDKDGKLVYPEKDYPDMLAVNHMLENMDFEIYQAVASACMEINPATSLKAKKKKS